MPAIAPPMMVSPAAPPARPADALADALSAIRAAPPGVPQGLWDEALAGPVSEFLSRPGKRFRGRLVHLAWALAGRRDAPPPQLALAVELLHAGSLVVDDIQDGSGERRGRPALHRLVGLPVALNAGNWMYFWPLTLLGEAGLPPAVELRLHRLTASAVRRCHEGQALDLAARVGELRPAEIRAVCRNVGLWKTGSLMGLAAALGSAAGGATEAGAAAATAFGESLGVALQMQNDLAELADAAAARRQSEDLAHGRVTWPWAWASERLDAGAFAALQRRVAFPIDGDAGPLAADLLAALGPDPRRPVRDGLADAYDGLAGAVGPHPALASVRAEIDRLLSKYA